MQSASAAGRYLRYVGTSDRGHEDWSVEKPENVQLYICLNRVITCKMLNGMKVLH